MKNKVKLASVFILGVVVGYLFSYFGSYISWFEFFPLEKDSEFARKCGLLNREDMTLENIHLLGGKCYKKGVLVECNQENIDRLKKKIDPFFDVTQGNLDNDWRCSIGITDDNKVIARPYFQYD